MNVSGVIFFPSWAKEAAVLVISAAKQLPSISQKFIDLLPKNVAETLGANAELKT